MRKKELFSKMNSLVDSLNAMQRQLKAAHRENAELKAELEKLTARIEELSSAPAPATALKEEGEGFEVRLDDETSTEEPAFSQSEETEPSKEDVTLPDEVMEYGSVAIGKIVQSSIKHANTISASESENTKELLNLIMGKGEIAKTEIFSIIEGEATPEIKRQLIDNTVAETTDYFRSVAGQI